jgi:hypothetical protein
MIEGYYILNWKGPWPNTDNISELSGGNIDIDDRKKERKKENKKGKKERKKDDERNKQGRTKRETQ